MKPQLIWFLKRNHRSILLSCFRFIQILLFLILLTFSICVQSFYNNIHEVFMPVAKLGTLFFFTMLIFLY